MDDLVVKRVKSWQLTEKSYKISLKVPASMYEELLDIMESGSYLNIPDYLSDLIRRDLKARKIKRLMIDE